MKNIYFIIASIIIMLYIVTEVRKKRFSIKESFWWVIASIAMLVLSIFPYSIDIVAAYLKVAYPPSLLFVLCIIFNLFINFKNSKKIAELQEKNIELAQQVALLKEITSRKK